MGRIKKLLDRELVGGTTDEEIYPISSTKAIYDENNQTVDYLLKLYLDKLNKLFARQGYYVCDSISTEPDKEIQVNNFELSTTIRLLVRMSKANLATSVSFEVNTTGAYPLYYNGAPASPENTWEADEVLDIYFDGNFFQAFRSKGSDTDALWELRVDEEGNDYLYTDKNVVIAKGLITYSSIAPIVPSIYEGIPFDNKTIWLNKETGVVEVIGGTGGGSSIDEKKLWEILGAEGADQIHESHIADILSKYSTTEKMWELLLANTEEQINISHLKTALSEFSSSEEFTGKYVTVDSKEQTIQGIKTFLNGLKIGEHLINVVDGVLYLDCSIAVTGGITAYAMGDRNIPTIMDGIVTDEQTITVKEIGGVKKLVVIGGTGGDFDESKLWKLLEAEGIQQINKSHLTTALRGYATTEQLNTKWTQDNVKISNWDEAYNLRHSHSNKSILDGITSTKISNWDTAFGWGNHANAGYAHLANEETFTGLKHFTKGITIGTGKHKLYEENGVVYFDGDLAVTGGITSFALAGRSVSTIMDGISVDGTTISKEGGYLHVVGGVGGASNWDDLEGKPIWITDTNPSYTKAESDSKYVTALGISGNNLTWTKNGEMKNITIPFATKSHFLGNHSQITDLNKPVWYDNGGNYGISINNYGINANNKPTTYNNANLVLNICNTYAGASSPYGWQLAFQGDSDGIFARRWDGDNLAGGWRTIAFSDSNVASASKLENARKIWGQSFNGTKDISGDLTNVGSINMSGNINGVKVISSITTNGGYNLHSGLASNESFRLDSLTSDGVWSANMIIGLVNGNIGIGTATPSERLHVNGTARATEFSINGKRLYVNGGVVYIDGDLSIKGNVLAEGGITAYASSFESNRIIEEVGGIKFSGEGSFDVDNLGNHYATSNSDIYKWSIKKYDGTAALSIQSSNGYVGIGTTNITDLLTVGGNTRITGNLVVDGTISGEGIGGGSVDFSELTSNESTNLAITVGGTRKKITNLYAYKADELTTPRYIWGQRFSGGGDIIGSLSNVTYINASDKIRAGKFSSGEYSDDKYAPYVCTRSGDSKTCYAFVNYQMFPFGIGYNNSNRIIMGVAQSDSTTKAWIEIGANDTYVHGNIHADGSVSQNSDRRFKSDIVTLNNRGYINPVTYIKDGTKQIGFIAQDVQELYPELIEDDGTENHYLSMNYSQYVAVLQAQIIELNERIKKLEQLNN